MKMFRPKPCRPSAALLFTGTAAILFISSGAALAVIPEPPNILYGTITLDNAPVTADMTNVVVEARRTTNGPVVASYRMGSDPQLGSYYSLHIPIESVAPITDDTNSQTGDKLIILLRDASGLRAQTNFTIVERGDVLRADFGTAVFDSDGDGLPDSWELAYFGSLGRNGSFVGLNGMTALQNYIAGTNPNDPNGGFKLFIVPDNEQRQVSFFAIRAAGPGYEGKSRYYTLESSSNPATNYLAVTGVTNILGNNQTVLHSSAAPTNLFFRSRVTLRGP
ncbi:MAG TPA: thrombospondin type 3 repeat-containing protein [Verrucomicrobiae bacterium]|nr:thrombospondin type 3 repeat-containing protein [Verrucomicrobiae bacterium]